MSIGFWCSHGSDTIYIYIYTRPNDFSVLVLVSACLIYVFLNTNSHEISAQLYPPFLFLQLVIILRRRI